MLLVVPEDHLEIARGLTPEKVHAIRHLLRPSIVTSGDLKVATGILEVFVEGLNRLMFPTQPETHPNLVFMQPNPQPTVGNPKAFLRYIRFVDELGKITSFGGLTVYVHLDPANGKFQFSMGICSENDHFNKHLASVICKNRFDTGNFYEVSQYDPDISVLANIYGAMQRYLHPKEFNDTLPRPQITRVPNKLRPGVLGKALQIFERYYSPVDTGSLTEIIKGKTQ